MIGTIIWDIDPKVFCGFEFLRWYGICWALGAIAGYRIILKIYQKEGTSMSELDRLLTYVIIAAIIGARLGHVLFYDPIYYLSNPIEILPIRINPTFEFTGLAGLASHGGILGALFGLFLYNRKFKKGYLWLLDRLTIAGAALGAFIRLGNLLNSEIIGTPTTLPWAFVFTRVDQIPRHPAQLYEAIFYLTICSILYFIWKSNKFYRNHGFIFGFGLSLIFLHRFLVEFVKENQVAFENTLMLNMGQILSIPLIFLGFSVMLWGLKVSPHTRE